MTTIEVRCPVGPRKLFTKLKLGEEFGKYLPDNTFELSCSDCCRRVRRQNSITFLRVLHRYNFVGDLVETVGVHGDGREEVLHIL